MCEKIIKIEDCEAVIFTESDAYARYQFLADALQDQNQGLKLFVSASILWERTQDQERIIIDLNKEIEDIHRQIAASENKALLLKRQLELMLENPEIVKLLVSDMEIAVRQWQEGDPPIESDLLKE